MNIPASCGIVLINHITIFTCIFFTLSVLVGITSLTDPNDTYKHTPCGSNYGFRPREKQSIRIIYNNFPCFLPTKYKYTRVSHTHTDCSGIINMVIIINVRKYIVLYYNSRYPKNDIAVDLKFACLNHKTNGQR